MTINQLSVFIENRRGRLAEITNILKNNEVDIRALSIADTKEFGILRLIVNHAQKAADVLRAEGFTVALTQVVAIGIDDRPGGLAAAMEVLRDNEISVEYMYAFISRDKGKAFVIIRVDNDEKAMEALRNAGVILLSAEEIHGM